MEKLSRQPGPQRPFEEMFELACEFLSSPWNIWENGALTAKRTVLKLAFAERPAYLRNQGFRTPKTTLPFKLLGDIHMGKCELAEREGFEPSVPAKAQRFSRPPRSTTPAPLRNRADTAPGRRSARLTPRKSVYQDCVMHLRVPLNKCHAHAFIDLCPAIRITRRLV